MKKIGSFLLPLLLMACAMSPAVAHHNSAHAIGEQDFGISFQSFVVSEPVELAFDEMTQIMSQPTKQMSGKIPKSGNHRTMHLANIDKGFVAENSYPKAKSGNHRTT